MVRCEFRLVAADPIQIGGSELTNRVGTHAFRGRDACSACGGMEPEIGVLNVLADHFYGEAAELDLRLRQLLVLSLELRPHLHLHFLGGGRRWARTYPDVKKAAVRVTPRRDGRSVGRNLGANLKTPRPHTHSLTQQSMSSNVAATHSPSLV